MAEGDMLCLAPLGPHDEAGVNGVTTGLRHHDALLISDSHAGPPVLKRGPYPVCQVGV